jgi:hypothetical protein
MKIMYPTKGRTSGVVVIVHAHSGGKVLMIVMYTTKVDMQACDHHANY